MWKTSFRISAKEKAHLLLKVSHVKIDIAFTAEMMYPYEERHTGCSGFLYGHGKMVTVSVEFRTQKFLGTVLGTKSHFRH